MTVDPEKEGIARLAESLDKVKPDLYRTFTAQAVDENIQQVDLGKQAAMTKSPGDLKRLQDRVDNKWFQFGANAESAYKQGEDLSAKLQLDMQHRRRDQSYDDAYAEWWAENQPTNIDPQFLATFNNAFMPNANKVKNQDIKREYDLNRSNAIAKSSRTVVDTLIEARKEGHSILAALDALKVNEQALYHFDNSTWNEVKFFAITAAADELDDPALLEVLNKSTFDQVTGQEIPGMAYTQEYGTKIANFKQALVRENERKEAKAETKRLRLENKMVREDTKRHTDIKMHIGDDGFLSNLTGDKRAQIRARGYLTVKKYTEAVKRLQKENNEDGTARFPLDDEKAQMKLRDLAQEEAIDYAVSNSWSNDELTKAERTSALVQKNNEVALNNLRSTAAGKQQLINYYKYQTAFAAGEPVPEDLITALPFDPSPELRKVAMKMGENEHNLKVLTERREVLRATNRNRRQDNYQAILTELNAQIANEEAIRDGLGQTTVEKPKEEDEIRAQIKRNAEAPIPELEEMFIDEDGGLTTFAKMTSAGYFGNEKVSMYDRYQAFNNNYQALKDRASGKMVNPPKGYKNWEAVEAEVASEGAYFAKLAERRKKNRNK